MQASSFKCSSKPPISLTPFLCGFVSPGACNALCGSGALPRSDAACSDVEVIAEYFEGTDIFLSKAQLDRGLYFRPPWNHESDIEINIMSCAVETTNRDKACSTAIMPIHILPRDDTPYFTDDWTSRARRKTKTSIAAIDEESFLAFLNLVFKDVDVGHGNMTCVIRLLLEIRL